MAEQRLMKEGLGASAVERIAESLARTLSTFPKEEFITAALQGIQPLELKARMRHIMRVLHRYLPSDFGAAAPLLIQLKSHWIAGDPRDSYAAFAAWPVIDYVGEYGLDDPTTSLAVLRELTPLFSAEFAVRPFLIQYPEQTLQTLAGWCSDPDEHVRRLVSEGTRPRLPWGQQLPQFISDPSPLFGLLERLKEDDSAYVRRSVANNLNDISKDHPAAVIARCREWKNSAWIVRHATRTLVKAGYPAVFELLGYTPNPHINVQALRIAPAAIRLGESIEFTVQLQSTHSAPQSMVIDYAVHHVKANGQTRPKVFKGKTLTLAGGETGVVKKTHRFKPITTRAYYSGEHLLEILVNGRAVARTPFILTVD